ncbi:MAG: DMT family transporter [Candidatus Cloacimonetes bacterium]|nr:DMT family transporter [Candidatus Cloacimonadota bacterium]
MENNKAKYSAYFFAGLAIAFWSTVSTAFKLSLRYQTSTQLLLGAALFSLIVITIFVIAQKKTVFLLQGSLRDIIRSALLGFLNPFLYYTVLLEAYDRLPAQEAQALNYIWAVMLALLAIPILKQRPRLRDISGVLLSFCGAVVIAFRGDFSTMQFKEPVGVTLALVSTLIWAIFWLFNVRDKRDEVVKLFWIFVFGFMYILIYAIAMGEIALLDMYAWLGAGYVGLFEMGITFIVWLMALQRAKSAARITNLIFLTPFISLVIINLILKERIALSTISGLVLIIGGILWQQSSKALPESRVANDSD